MIGRQDDEASFNQPWPAKPRVTWRQIKGFAGCGWLKATRQTAAHIVRYFHKKEGIIHHPPTRMPGCHRLPDSMQIGLQEHPFHQ